MVGKLYKSIYLWILVSSTSMTAISYATCTPKPNCDAIGYTETSCETDYLACPFDNTKLKCMPCDSTYRYNCIGENITKGIGDTCNGKYTSCECIKGAIFDNGSCVCDTSCTVGNIYYSDKTCNSCVDSSKTAIGIVIKDNEIITALQYTNTLWAPDNFDFTEIENVNSTTAPSQMNGYNESQIIVNHYGEDADDTSISALYCNNYKPINAENTLNTH